MIREPCSVFVNCHSLVLLFPPVEVDLRVVYAGVEPAEFRDIFPCWTEFNHITELQMAEGRKMGENTSGQSQSLMSFLLEIILLSFVSRKSFLLTVFK